ncbi:MAG: dephospho-CoA kinase [Ferrovibrio sp.]|uniref:dephospho-CoA kinase n=1 Tax=Ferrovibrio sp. TaxID=1917215 RepID=UPI0026212091|nr:dephospho-CoA kinase [Ferrovibrio sp.]MCW0233088.1 dephospho-CoA kinase [Ferrovibrio sp.]
MLKIGLTGSIGMGKTTVAKMFAARGIPVFDADAAVHTLYERGGAAVDPVGEAFPGSLHDGAVDRAALSRLVVGKPAEIKRLEAIVHPLVAGLREAFLRAAEQRGEPMVVLEIQMLLEGSSARNLDVIVVVSAPEAMQRDRALARPGMSAEKLAGILSNQMPDAEKRARADYVIDTGVSLAETEKQVEALIATLRHKAGNS